MAGIVYSFWPSGCSPPSPGKLPNEVRLSAPERYAQFKAELKANDTERALHIAEDLLRYNPATKEADSVASKLPAIREAVVARHHAQVLAAKWTYNSSQDPMTGRPARYATILSENAVNFGFPYNGLQRGTITIRDHPTYGHDVIFSIERGQIQCPSYEDCAIRIRFDLEEASQWSAVGPSDNSTTSVFIRNHELFVAKLRAARTVLVQIPVYQEGEPLFEFAVGGFNYSQYRGYGITPAKPQISVPEYISRYVSVSPVEEANGTSLVIRVSNRGTRGLRLVHGVIRQYDGERYIGQTPYTLNNLRAGETRKIPLDSATDQLELISGVFSR
jgi:hypothetical protein